MPIPRCVLPLLGLAVSMGTATPAENEEPPPAKPLTVIQVAEPARFFNKTPEEIFKMFGRPVAVISFPFNDHDIVHTYDVERGGRIGFLLSEPWHVVGIVYDNLRSTNFFPVSAFFPKKDPRKQRLLVCLATWFYNRLPGDEEVNGWACQWTVSGRWGTADGGQFVARYRLDGHGIQVYDPVTAAERMLPPTDLNNLRVIQWGLFSPECRCASNIYLGPGGGAISPDR